MFIELFVPPFTLVGDFDDVFFLGRLCRPLAHSSRRTHGGRYGGGEEESAMGTGEVYVVGPRSYHFEFIDRLPFRHSIDTEARRDPGHVSP